jgi:cobalt/nickel transport system permease protein
LHRRNGTCKLIALLVLLIGVATCSASEWTFPAIATGVLLTLARAASLPVWGVIRRAAFVLLFALPFSIMIILTGDLPRGFTLVVRTYCSAVAIVLYAGVTPVPETIAALRTIGFPPVLVEVIQFVYRYLFVIGDQARSMNIAATSRGAVRVGASAGAVATLFGRAYQRAEAVHRSMLSRGYRGDMPALFRRRANRGDLVMVAAVITFVVSLRTSLYLVSK